MADVIVGEDALVNYMTGVVRRHGPEWLGPIAAALILWRFMNQQNRE